MTKLFLALSGNYQSRGQLSEIHFVPNVASVCQRVSASFDRPHWVVSPQESIVISSLPNFTFHHPFSRGFNPEVSVQDCLVSAQLRSHSETSQHICLYIYIYIYTYQYIYILIVLWQEHLKRSHWNDRVHITFSFKMLLQLTAHEHFFFATMFSLNAERSRPMCHVIVALEYQIPFQTEPTVLQDHKRTLLEKVCFNGTLLKRLARDVHQNHQLQIVICNVLLRKCVVMLPTNPFQ